MRGPRNVKLRGNMLLWYRMLVILFEFLLFEPVALMQVATPASLDPIEDSVIDALCRCNEGMVKVTGI